MKAVAIFASVIAALVLLYVVSFPSATIRYRLTIDAIVDGAPVKGSGVIQYTYRTHPTLFGARSNSTEIVGEAVQVDLGPMGLLLALLASGSNPRSTPEFIIPVAFGVTSASVDPKEIGRLRQLGGERELPFDLLPLMILLRDPANPSSVVLVNPLQFSDAVGTNAALKRVTVEIVDSGIWPLTLLGLTGTKVTNGIGAKLPWLGNQSQITVFWKALLLAGYVPSGIGEITSLFKRGG